MICYELLFGLVMTCGALKIIQVPSVKVLLGAFRLKPRSKVQREQGQAWMVG